MNFESTLHLVTSVFGVLCAISCTTVLIAVVRERRKPRTRMRVQVTVPDGETIEFVIDRQDWPALERRFRDLHPERLNPGTDPRLAH